MPHLSGPEMADVIAKTGGTIYMAAKYDKDNRLVEPARVVASADQIPSSAEYARLTNDPVDRAKARAEAEAKAKLAAAELAELDRLEAEADKPVAGDKDKDQPKSLSQAPAKGGK